MLTITKSGAAEQTTQKSCFIAFAAACKSEAEVGAFLRAMAAQHNTAGHLAYAFIVKTPASTVARFSDAGEPSGTAGKPILQMLEGRQLINNAIGVIRYYGGINLGTGGLARAYGGTAKMALDAAKIVDFVEMQEILIIVEYSQLDTLLHAVANQNGVVLDKTFDAKVQVKMAVPKVNSQILIDRFG